MIRDFRRKIALSYVFKSSGKSIIRTLIKKRRTAIAFSCILLLLCGTVLYEPYLQNNVLAFADEIPADTEAPTSPVNLASTSKTDRTVDLSWTASTDNTGVSLYRVFNGTSTVLEVSGTNCVVQGLEPNTTYTFVVKAQDSAGNISEASNEITVTTNESTSTSVPQMATNSAVSTPESEIATNPAVILSVPEIPTNTAVSASYTSITITWSEVSNSTGYEIEADGTIIDNGTSTSYAQTGLTPNTEHTYRVRAKNTSGTSEWTVSVKAKTLSDLSNGLLSFEKTNYTATIPNYDSNIITVSANGTDSNGNPINVSDISYSFDNTCTGVAINSSTGAITITPFAQAGSVQVIATYQNITGSAVLALESSASKNLALGKTYTKSECPEFEDSYDCESTDGILAGDYSDGHSYGYRIPANTTKTVAVTVDLGDVLSVNDVKVHKWEGAYPYGADNIKIYKSQDGTNYELIGCSKTTDSKWKDFSFLTIETRYVKVEFSKTNDGAWGHDWLFIDEIQIYKSEITNTSNLALGKTYTKSERPEFEDSCDCESTDGILAGDYSDGHSYGYRIPANTTKTVAVTVDLGDVLSVNDVKVHKWEGAYPYGADNIKIYKSQDGTNYELIGCSKTIDSKWKDFSFLTIETRYVKVEFSKTNDGAWGHDWLFIDEIQIYKSEIINTSNLALGKTYTKSEQPEQWHGDTNNSESTDGILAGDYADGKSYGYTVPANSTKTVNVAIALESLSSVNEIKVHKWEGSSHYGADTIRVYKSEDGTNYELIDCSSSPGSIWIDFSFSDVKARYIKVEFSKTNNGVPGNDWLFIDEIEVYGLLLPPENKKASLTISTISDNIYNIPVKVNNVSNFAGSTFILTYDISALELLDLSDETFTKEITPGSIPGTGITVISVSDGIIEMTIDKSIPADKKWSGIINVFKFKAKITGETIVSVGSNLCL